MFEGLINMYEMEDRGFIDIGEYTISMENDENYWIQRNSGEREGIQISTEKLEEWLDKLWEEEF